MVGVLSVGLTSCSEDPALATTQRIIDDLAAQRFGAATSRFRRDEPQVLSPAAAPIWRGALGHDDSTVREWAVDALARIGDPQDVPRLVERLDDSSRGVRRQAMTGLASVDPAAAAAAFGGLLSRREPESVVLGAQGLAELGDPAAVAAIVARFVDESLPASSRATLTQSLASLGSPEAAGALLQVAVDDAADLQLRRLAAEALLVLDGEGIAAAAKRLLTIDDPYISDLAARALAGGELR